MILAFGVKEFVYFGSKKLSGSINSPRLPKFIPNLHELAVVVHVCQNMQNCH